MHQVLAFVATTYVVVAILLLLPVFCLPINYVVTIQLQISLAVVILALTIILIWMIFKAKRANQFKIKTGKEVLIGSIGCAVTDLKPEGEIRVVGEFWQATTKEGPIKNGEKVEVVGMEGMFLVVKPIKEKLNLLK